MKNLLSSPLSALKNNRLISFSISEPEHKNKVPVFENIDKHLSVLHHRNAQLRNAILSGSVERVTKRRDQFREILNSYIRIIVVDLHGPISNLMLTKNMTEYTDVRNKSFAEYEKLMGVCNISAQEMLALGTDFTRQLFQLELKIKKYKQVEEKVIYPLYKAI